MLPSELDALLSAIRASSKYAQVSEDVIRRIGASELRQAAQSQRGHQRDQE